MGGRKRSSEDWQGSREYVWKGLAYPSVTTILSAGVPKQKVLLPWASRTAAEYAVDHRDEIDVLLAMEGGRQLAIDAIRGAPDRAKERGGDRGTSIHDLAEKRAAGEDIIPDPSDPVHQLALGLTEYVRDKIVQPLYSEITVFSLKYGYAGSLDAIQLWNLDGRQMLIDYKTGKRPYPEVALQLSAYAHADFWDDDGTERPLPRIDGAAVVHLSDAGYRVREVDIGEDTFRAFRAARVVGDFLRRGDRVFRT